MKTTADDDRAQHLDGVLALVRAKLQSGQREVLERFIVRYFGQVDSEDLAERAPADLYGAALSHWHFARKRERGQARVRVFNPRIEEHGWQSTHTIIEIVNDDMPFLVDTVTMEVNRNGLTLHLIIHPVLAVLRGNDKSLIDVADENSPDAPRESFIHVEIDRVIEPERLDGLAQDVARVLGDVRRVVTDWEQMQGKLLSAVAELDARPPPIPPEELAEGKAFLSWLAADHFTLIGYRCHDLVVVDGEDALRIVPGTSLGILREDAKKEVATSFAALPPEVRAHARVPELLIVTKANAAIADIAKLNDQIIKTEVGGSGMANDLRDLRQQKIEELSKLVDITSTAQSNGAVDITMGGVAMTNGPLVLDQLEAFDNGGGQLLVRAQTAGTTLALTGGSIQGTIDARDGALAGLRSQFDILAGQLITEINGVHSAGYDLSGNTGEAFFTGTDAATIRVNNVLVTSPGRIQAASVPGAVGDNRVALALAQLADKKIATLGNQTFSQSYGQSVASLGQSLSSVNSQIDNQAVVENMLSKQRDSISGVSLDEEMTDLIRFQKAFQASARLITTIDEMLDTIVNMKR